MPDPEMTPPDSSAFERALRALRPTDGGVVSSAFLLRAGQASRDRAVRRWRIAAIGAAVTAVGVAAASAIMLSAAERRLQVALTERDMALTNRPGEAVEPVSPPVVVPPSPSDVPPVAVAPHVTPRSVPVDDDPDPDALAEALRTRQEILTAGLGLVPTSQPRPPRPTTPDSLLGGSPGVFAVPPARTADPLDPPPDQP